MLPNINRLTKKKDFDMVFKNGESIKSDFLVLKVLKNQFDKSRFGFVVSKKISNKATIRNLVKRRLRGAVSEKLSEVKGSADIVIITLPGIEKKRFSQIREVIAGIFKKAKLTPSINGSTK